MFHERLNQSTLAKKSGVLRVSLSNILNGKTEPTLKTIEKLAQALEVDPVDLMNGSYKPLPKPLSKMSKEEIDFEAKSDEIFGRMETTARYLKAQNRDKFSVAELDDVEMRDLLKALMHVNVAEVYSLIDKTGPSLSPEQKELVALVLRIPERALLNDDIFADIKTTIEATFDQEESSPPANARKRS